MSDNNDLEARLAKAEARAALADEVYSKWPLLGGDSRFGDKEYDVAFIGVSSVVVGDWFARYDALKAEEVPIVAEQPLEQTHMPMSRCDFTYEWVWRVD
jgi:hypothetical protein